MLAENGNSVIKPQIENVRTLSKDLEYITDAAICKSQRYKS